MRYNNLFGLYIATICTLYLKALYGAGSGVLYRDRCVDSIGATLDLNEYTKNSVCRIYRKRSFCVCLHGYICLYFYKTSAGLTDFGRQMLPIIDALADFGNYYKSVLEH